MLDVGLEPTTVRRPSVFPVASPSLRLFARGAVGGLMLLLANELSVGSPLPSSGGRTDGEKRLGARLKTEGRKEDLECRSCRRPGDIGSSVATAAAD